MRKIYCQLIEYFLITCDVKISSWCHLKKRENDGSYSKILVFEAHCPMEQQALKNVNNYLNANIYSCLEISGCQSSNLYSHVVHFFNKSVNLTSVPA
jgi:hypothetical protein